MLIFQGLQLTRELWPALKPRKKNVESVENPAWGGASMLGPSFSGASQRSESLGVAFFLAPPLNSTNQIHPNP